jgi:hypothetical protein
MSMVSPFSVQHRHFYGLAPTIEEGPRLLVKSYTVVGAATLFDNLTKEIMQKEMSFVQGVYFNNKLGGGIVTLVGLQAEQSIELANKTQGFLPLFWGPEPEFSVTFAAAGTVTFHFVNVPVAPQIWTTT